MNCLISSLVSGQSPAPRGWRDLFGWVYSGGGAGVTGVRAGV